jgi:NTE family protein
VADAVAASCAIPGFYRPGKIGRRRYVDGGVCSASNADLLAGRGLDHVICMNPLSSADASRSVNPVDWPGQLSRAANGRRLASEVRKVRAYGTDVVLIQPTAADLAVMGRNLMSPARRDEVIATADRTVAEQLRAPGVRVRLRGLPQGEPHKVRRPDGPPSTWPAIGRAARPRPGGAAAEGAAA